MKLDSSLRYLVTGGCGFIGASFIEYLIGNASPSLIRVLDNLSVGTRSELDDVCDYTEKDGPGMVSVTSSVELVEGDIKDYDTCFKCCKDIDVVIHLAANTGVVPSVDDPRSDMEANVYGTFNMLEASRLNGVDKFIFASSGAPLGEVEPPIHEKIAPRPVSPYGASKLAGEGYCSAFYWTFGLKTVSLRFGNVYGPRSKHKDSVVAKFFKRALKGEPLEIYGDGNQTRDFIHVQDLMHAIALSISPDPDPRNSDHTVKAPWGEVFQIATHKETTINEIAQHISRIVSNKTGNTVKIIHDDPRTGEVMRNYSLINKALQVLGWSPQYSLETGLEQTFNYFISG